MLLNITTYTIYTVCRKNTQTFLKITFLKKQTQFYNKYYILFKILLYVMICMVNYCIKWVFYVLL